MSARQRHSRVTNSDGWTTISSANKQKKKSKHRNPEHSSASTGTELLSALLAHKTDLDGENEGDSEDSAKGPTSEELERAKNRLQSQINTFAKSTCRQKLKELFRKELGAEKSKASLEDQDEVQRQSDTHATSDERFLVNHVLILALGKLSSSFLPAPGYQLAAALAIVEVLRDNLGLSPSSESVSQLSAAVEKLSVNEPTVAETEQEEKTENRDMHILSFDPVYTPLDKYLLKHHGIESVTASSIPDLPSPDSPSTASKDSNPAQTSPFSHLEKDSWYSSSVIYMPHASIWLNHKYFMTKPKVWIGNTFDVYRQVVREALDNQEPEGGVNTVGKQDIALMIKEVYKLMEEYQYEKLEWPETEWGGGGVFNETVIYIRRRD